MRRPARNARSASRIARAARAARPALLALVAFALLGPARAAAQLEFEGTDEPTVRRVEIEGNQAYSDGTLKSIIRTRATSFFHPWRSAPLRSDFLRFDRIALRDFYRRHGYLGADVESIAVSRHGEEDVDVRFLLDEGPRARVQSIDFDGTTPGDEEAIRAVIPLEAGGFFDFPSVQLSHAAIDSFYAERGHVIASIRDSMQVVGPDVRVGFRIVPGPAARLRRIVVEGTSATKPGFVSREVTIRPGEVLARSQLLRSQQRIYDSGLYGDVQFSTGEIDSVTNETDLIVSVRERSLGWIDAGIGYGTIDQARLTAQMGQRNLFRENVRFLATARFGVRAKTKPQFPYISDLFLGERHADAALTRDWLFGYRVQGTIGVFGEEVPPFLTETKIPLRSVGASAGLRYAWNRWTSANLGFETRYVDSDSASVKDQVGTPLNSYTRNSIAATIARDTRVNLFDPRTGTVAAASTELVGGVLRGNSRYLKFTGTATNYRPLSRRLTFAIRGSAGTLAGRGQGPAAGLEDSISALDLIPEEDRFRTGGATTVRGYQEDEIGTQIVFGTDSTGAVTRTTVRRGGAYLLQGNAEVRARLIGFLGAAAFVDAGGVWEHASDITWSRVFSFSDGAGYNDMRWTAGLGVRIATPVGPVRLDYGWKMRLARGDQPDAVTGRGSFHFSLGQAY
ncbi:MAG TPA: BamA/TamA family outer membrane protein [Candidatus Eisenbacteria bacterium]|nr:BamA/TamA family outer membrane protein [Candidatus Eisenbacteria bacterium]